MVVGTDISPLADSQTYHAPKRPKSVCRPRKNTVDPLNGFNFQILHNIDPIRKFAAIRVDQYKLVVNQDAVFRTTWYSRYEVRDEPGSGASSAETTAEARTLPGSVVDCGLAQNTDNDAVHCNTDLFPCLFDISKGNQAFF